MPLGSTAHVDGFARASLPAEETWPTIEFTIPDVVYPDRLNAATELINGAVASFGPERVCMRAPAGTTWSYGEVLERANQIAHVLTEDLGIVPGNRVLLRGPNTPWLAIVWLAVLKAGAIAVTTMHVLRAAELTPILAATRPQLALCDSRYVDDIVGQEPLTRETVVTFDVDATDGGELGRLAAAHPTVHDDVQTSADDVALLAPTSGTTGTPKITVHFHRDILANADTFARHVLRPVPDDVFSGTPPLAFTFGLGGLVVFPLRFGASTVLIERATPSELADLAERYGITVMFTAPTAYRAIIREGAATKLSGVRRAVSAGEHLSEAVWRDVRDQAGLELINGIGSTEMLHIFISAADGSIRPGSTGRPVPGYRATILDDDGNEAPVGALGRLAVIGPTGCRYLHGDRQGKYVESGWNVTGDTYRRDEDGYFWYEARSDSMIISSGYNIGAPEVESALCAHRDVLEAGVVGKPDAERGAIVTAFVVLRDGIAGDDAKRLELQNHVKATLAPYKYPRELHFAEALPRNPSGKLQHFRLRELLATATRKEHA
ncbi:AMP-binding protein [Microbacterium sp. SSM24]|uniref:AMP-binding protein n=1 Tax=Microbacterium sp. SSM24 TaxID=2991714 RepID=UPI0022274B98|nr:AMP-binding protein [Microbacterium sp. SSM24]MCW3492603.1 AMP-binding protein [Microbacterium sp. SSM24]